MLSEIPSFEYVIFERNGDKIVFLSSVNDKNPRSNKKSKVGVSIKPFFGSVFSKSFEAAQGLIWLAIKSLSSDTKVIGQKGQSSKSFFLYSPCPTLEALFECFQILVFEIII